MAASDHKATAARDMLALAAVACYVMIAATLLLSSAVHDVSRDDSQSRTRKSSNGANTTRSEYLPLIDESESIRRRLSSSYNLHSCPEINRTPPQLPIHYLLQTSTYAASFPGSDYDLITKHLVESVTGMLVGEASTSPSLERMKVQEMDRTGFARGQGEVVALRTEFPHTSGKLSAWDDHVTRAFVVLRNPVHAIPRYFDQIYERNGRRAGASPGSSNETVAAWIKWRDNQFADQLLLYRRFVSVWMEKYSGRDDMRTYFSYEGLMDEEEGSREAVRLAAFLKTGVEASAMEITRGDEGPSGPFVVSTAAEGALRTFADIEEVPCIWNDIVRTAILDGKLSTQYSPEKANTERPFTTENLVAAARMLLDLMNRWSHHERVLRILSGYHKEVSNVAALLSLVQ